MSVWQWLASVWQWLVSSAVPWVLARGGQQIGGWLNNAATFVLVVKAVWDWWRNRERLVVRLLSLTQYWWSWDENDVAAANRGPYPGSIEVGDPRRVFTVMEFEVVNRHRIPVSIGRFLIEDWIYADHYEKGIYDRFRDYRVFDLFSRERVSLDRFTLVEPGHAVGFRVEILDQGYDPAYNMPMHRPAKPVLYDAYRIQFHTDLGRRHVHTFRIRDGKRVRFDDPYQRADCTRRPHWPVRPERSDKLIYRWSDDLIPSSDQGLVFPTPLPQPTSPGGWDVPAEASSPAFSIRRLLKAGGTTDPRHEGSLLTRVREGVRTLFGSGRYLAKEDRDRDADIK